MKIELSVVLPCYNESKNIPVFLKKFDQVLNKTKTMNFELILVDNNSKDETNEVLKKELKKYNFARSVFQATPGYGAAIMKGLESAKGDFICWSHADMQTHPKDTIKALRLIKRQINPLKTYVKGRRCGRPILDTFLTFGMSVIETIYLGKPLYDINAQPNLFHNSFLKKMKDPPTDFSFDLYTYYIARKKGFKIVRFPVHFGPRLYGESAWNNGLKARFKFIKRTLNFTYKLKKQL